MLKIKTQIRRFNGFLYNVGLRKAEKVNSYKRRIDARSHFDGEILQFSGALKKPVKTFENINDTEVSKSPYDLYMEFRAKAIESNSVDISRDEYVKSFIDKVRKLDYSIKETPFSRNSIKVKKNDLEEVYEHLIGQVYDRHPEKFQQDPILLFKGVQCCIESHLYKIKSEGSGLDLIFHPKRFIRMVSANLNQYLENLEHVKDSFVRHNQCFEEVSSFRFY